MTLYKYYDLNSKQLTEKEISKGSKFYKISFDQYNDIKSVELIENNEVVGIEYYVGTSESLDNYRSKVSKFDSITLNTNKIKRGSYSKYEVLTINRDGKEAMKRIQVFGELPILPIYDASIDLLTGKETYISKHLYSIDTGLHFEFEYDLLNGNIDHITVLDPNNFVDTDDRTISPDEVGNNRYNFNWIGFEYYKNADPLFPISDIKPLELY